MNKTIHIDGMMCTHCTGRVEKALNDLPGVEATVDLDSKSAAVTCTPDVSDDTLRQAVEDAGPHHPMAFSQEKEHPVRAISFTGCSFSFCYPLFC